MLSLRLLPLPPLLASLAVVHHTMTGPHATMASKNITTLMMVAADSKNPMKISGSVRADIDLTYPMELKTDGYPKNRNEMESATPLPSTQLCGFRFIKLEKDAGRSKINEDEGLCMMICGGPKNDVHDVC